MDLQPLKTAIADLSKPTKESSDRGESSGFCFESENLSNVIRHAKLRPHSSLDIRRAKPRPHSNRGRFKLSGLPKSNCEDKVEIIYSGLDDKRNEDKRTCILSGGVTSLLEGKKFTGTSWISVIGTEAAISLVSMATYPDPENIRRPPLSFVMKNEFADLTALCSKSVAVRPFAVVCVAPNTFDDFIKNVSLKKQGSEAINFLEEKLKSCPILSLQETKQIAVCALKILFGAEFKSDQIQLRSSDICNTTSIQM